MSRSLILGITPTIKIELVTEGQESQVTIQSANSDWSDCACSPTGPSNKGAESMIKLKFTNRKRELEQILNPGLLSQLMIIDGPAGYGKSTILNQVYHEYKEKRWNCALLDLSILKGKQAIRKAIADQIGAKTIKDSDDGRVDFILRESIGNLGKTILLFDAVERAEEDDINWLVKDFINNIHLPGSTFRVVLAGRYTHAQTSLKPTITIKKPILPEEWKDYGYKRVRLTPFGQTVIEELIEKTVAEYPPEDFSFQSGDYIYWVRFVMHLSGGHPKSIQNLLTRYASKWKRPSQEDERYIFQECVASEIQEAIADQGEEVRQWLEILSIFRLFNLNTIQHLQAKNKISENKDALSILTTLVKAGFVEKNIHRPFYSDDIVRNLFLLDIRLRSPKKYQSLHRLAQDMYDAWIESTLASLATLSLLDNTNLLDYTQESVLDYIKESIYHNFEQSFSEDSVSIFFSRLGEKYGMILVKLLGEDLDNLEQKNHLGNIIWEDEDIRTILKNQGINKQRLLDYISNSTYKGVSGMTNESFISKRSLIDWLVDTLDMLRHNAQNVLIERWENRNQGKATTPPVFADRNISAEHLARLSREDLAKTLPPENILMEKLTNFQDASGKIVIINEKYVKNLKEQMQSAQATKGEYELELTRALSPNERIQVRQGLEESQKIFDEAAGKLADIYVYICSQ